MLETSQERVKLLKAGVSDKNIEKLYIIYNNFIIVQNPVLFEMIEINAKGHENVAIGQGDECYG